MDLNPSELASLAVFFGKRFPHADERAELAAAAGLPAPSAASTSAHAAWERLLADAQQSGKLARLAHIASRQEPDDRNLRRAAELIGPPPSVWPRLALATVAVGIPLAAVFALIVFGAATGGLEDSAATAAPVVTEPVADVVVEPQGVALAAEDAVVAAEPVVEPVGEAQEAPVVAPAQTREAPVQHVVTASEAPVAGSGLAAANGRCTLEGGGLVGYWYAGDALPGATGEVITMGEYLNVRAYVPSEANGFDARGEVRCVLEPGDRVRLSHAAVPVPVDAYWVPLYSGDLTAAN